jgi:uroporphyrinogen decarboxylase
MPCDAPNIERIFAAFEHRKLDRVPNFEILIEDRHTSRLLGRAVGHTLGSAKGASEDEYVAPPMDVRDYVEICGLIGQDAVGMEALWAPLKRRGDDGKLHIITDGSVHTWEQLDRVVPHSRELDIEPKRRFLREYVAATRGTGVGVTIMTAAPIMTPYQFIVGFEEFMVKLITDRDFIQKTISMCMDYYLDVVAMACEEGVSFIYIGDDIGGKGGLLMGPELTRKYAIPCYERIVNLCRRYKVPVALHSCGNAVEAIPDLIDIGVVMYNPVEPTSGADIYEVFKKYGDKICLSGNIDIAGVLAFGSPEDVEKDVREHIERLAGNGNYILTTSHSVTNDIPFENFMAMIAAGHRFGRFPLGKDTLPDPGCYAANSLRELRVVGAPGRGEAGSVPAGRSAGAKNVTGAEIGPGAAGEVFTPVTQYGVCGGCGTRAVTFLVPDGRKLCERCFKKEGWALVHEGPGKGWHRKTTADFC